MDQKQNGLSMKTRKEQTNDRANDLTETYWLGLLCRAIRQDDREARLEFVQHFGEMMDGWLHRHPLWETACRYGSEEYYVTQAFERFQQSAIQQPAAFKTLTEALAYLRVSLNGVILEVLRAHKRPEAVPGPMKGLSPMDSPQEFWQRLQKLLPDNREQQLVYLLYHCGLQPTEIVRLYPQEWTDVPEIIRLQAIILRRLLAELPLIAAEAAQISAS